MIVQDQDDYLKKYKELEARYQKAKDNYDKLIEEKHNKQSKAIALKSYRVKLENADQVITEWEDSLWMTVLDKAVVNKDKTITFYFIIGKEIILKILRFCIVN